ncbi:MAG: HDOD domain-containing protein [bacterium]
MAVGIQWQGVVIDSKLYGYQSSIPRTYKLNSMNELEPVKQLSRSRQAELLARSHRERISARKKIRSTDYRYCFLYLMSGEVVVEPQNGDKFSVKARDIRSKQPIFLPNSYMDSLVTTADCEFLKVDRALFEQIYKDQSAEGMEVQDVQVQLSDGSILRRLFEDYKSNSIPVPSMPEIAIKIQRMAEDEDASIADLSDLIENDPAMAGKIVSAANNVLIRGRSPISSVKDGLVRLGMKTARQLIISMAVKDLFEARQPRVRKRMNACWEHAVLVAFFSRIVARETGQLNTDFAFLTGLLHDIGAVSILNYLEITSEGSVSEGLIAQALAGLRSLVSVLVLQSWRMNDEMINAAENAGQVDTELPNDAGYLEILNVAKQQAWLYSKSAKMLPPVSNFPGYKRFELGEVTESGFLQCLEDHKKEYESVLSVLVD